MELSVSFFPPTVVFSKELVSRFQINGNGVYSEINDASIRLDVYVFVEVDNVSFRGKKRGGFSGERAWRMFPFYS